MKKLLFIFFLLLGAVYAPAQSTDDPNYRYFYLPLQRLLAQNPSAEVSLVGAAQILPDNYNYAALLPRQSRAVLLGEIHDRDAIVREINHIISQLGKNKNLGFTHFATEFLPQSSQKAFEEAERKNIPFDQLGAYINPNIEFYDSGLTAMRTANRLGLQVVGLDIDDILEKGGTAWALTDEGLKKRNEAWFSAMDNVFRRQDRARFMVHCGSLHSQYNIENSLGDLLKRAGTDPLVILFESGPDTAEQLTCENISASAARYTYGWYEFFCRHGLADKNLILKVPPQYADKLGMDVLVYIHNHNALRDMAKKDMERLLKETGFLKYKDSRTHPDSTASQILRRATFSQ